MVLWVITVLSVVVLEFCFAMRTEVNITKNFMEELRLYAMAEGGVERAIAELIYKHDPKIQQIRRTLLQTEGSTTDKKEWMGDGRPYLLRFDQGTCEIRMIRESGKINTNIASEMMLRRIMGNLGLEGEIRDIVVDSILDWRDPNDFYRPNGAENDYYQSLKEPYLCKNSNLDSIEELLLIRGITPDLFYGKKGIKKEEEERVDRIGLKEIFSIYSTGDQIDINSATLPVLRVVLGIPKEMAQRIIEAREKKEFQNQQDLVQRVPEISPWIGEIGRFILYRSVIPYYTIESKAWNKEGGTTRGLKTIIKIDPKEKKGYKFIQWVDVMM